MRLTRRALNRTLLLRQGLLRRTTATPAAMAGHLLGLQGQETLPPYLSLAARLEGFDPYVVTRGLENGDLVRLGTMRGTLHLHPAEQALALRPWLQPALERQTTGRAGPVEHTAVWAATEELLADGPLDQKSLAAGLEQRLGGKGADLWVVARTTMPLVQLPPRGTWQGSGGVVLDHLERWTRRTAAACTNEDVVRAYLRAYGPATAADITAWSGVTGLAPVVKAMGLVRHEDEDGKPLYDVEGAELADGTEQAPTRLLGTYDNLWLAHAKRDRVTTAEQRERWSGPNGAFAATVFVDGWLTGLWRVEGGRAAVIELFRTLTRREEGELDDERDRVQALLDS